MTPSCFLKEGTAPYPTAKARSMADSHLDRQIEQIVEESEGERLSVIVQMKTEDNIEEHVRATTEAIDMRRAVTSARSLVPPGKQQLKVGTRGTITPATAKKLEQSDLLAASVFLASSMIGPPDWGLGAQALKGLLNSDWVASLFGSK